MSVYVVVGRLAPYGHDAFLYASVSVTPFIIWSYVSRFTIMGAITNKSFLQYPIVKPLDLMLSRVVLEAISCFVVVVGLFLALTVAGSEPMPHRLDQAVFAMLSALLLGIGCGIFGSVITMIFPLFNIVYVIIVIIMWAISGVAIDPEGMPTIIGDMLAWNPLLHSIEWMRWAYYDDFPARLLNRAYVFYFGAVALFLGLIMERALRVFTTR